MQTEFQRRKVAKRPRRKSIPCERDKISDDNIRFLRADRAQMLFIESICSAIHIKDTKQESGKDSTICRCFEDSLKAGLGSLISVFKHLC